MDMDHENWGWLKLKKKGWLEDVLPTLKAFEKMTWAEIKAAAGGRGEKGGTNHHSVECAACTKQAKDRLEVLKLDDYENLFSLRLENKVRLYGIRDGRALKLLWHDPYHGNNGMAVYPTKKR